MENKKIRDELNKMQNEKIIDVLLKDAKKDPIGSVLFWHKSYLVALYFLDEKGLREEYHKFEEQFDIK